MPKEYDKARAEIWSEAMKAHRLLGNFTDNAMDPEYAAMAGVLWIRLGKHLKALGCLPGEWFEEEDE